MDQFITPAIWCDGTADEAAQFYTDVFRDTSIAEQAPGLTATVSIHGSGSRSSTAVTNMPRTRRSAAS